MPFTFLEGKRVYYDESTHMECANCHRISPEKTV